MARWLVKLDGEPIDLEDFPYWFPHGPIYAVADATGTYIAGESFETYIDASEVYQAAGARLDEMHAAINLLDSGVQIPELGAVIREDDAGIRKGFVLASATMRGRSKVRGALSAIGSENVVPTETQAQQLLKTARENRHLHIALLLLAMPRVSWPHLYRALEEIEAHIGAKPDDAGLCLGTDYVRFKRSANSGEVAGTDSRHRVGKYEPPKQPMTLQDARNFVRHCLNEALRRCM